MVNFEKPLSFCRKSWWTHYLQGGAFKNYCSAILGVQCPNHDVTLQIFNQCIFHFRELELHYELYLKVKLGISDGKIANSIKSVFTALTAPREITEEVSSLAMCLPIFYEAFINRFK